MKLIEKLAYISFWINIVFVIFVFIGMPVLIIKSPGILDLWASNKGRNPINITYAILSFAVVFHWGYCIWFLYKHDRYSKSIFLLFFFNFLYAPIYYYRVKIKKRPLRNKINKPKEVETEDKSISDYEFIQLTRDSIIGVITLWSSREEQLEYQKSTPNAHLSTELFGQWSDLYTADSEVMTYAFDQHELEMLSKFDSALKGIEEKLIVEIPHIEDFIKTNDWEILNLLAKETLKSLK